MVRHQLVDHQILPNHLVQGQQKNRNGKHFQPHNNLKPHLIHFFHNSSIIKMNDQSNNIPPPIITDQGLNKSEKPLYAVQDSVSTY